MGKRGRKGNFRFRAGISDFGRLTILIAVTLALLALVSAPFLDLVYNSGDDIVFYNNTESTEIGARIFFNASGTYNGTRGDFKSLVFYNTTQTYWNITFGIDVKDLANISLASANSNITLQTRTANSYNLTDANLTAFWSFNNATQNATGDLAYDETGVNNGTVIGAVNNEGNGTVGMGYYFDGADDYIDVPNSASVNPIDAMTLSVWIRIPEYQDWRRILTKGGSGYELYMLGLSSSNGIYFSLDNGGGQTYIDGATDIPLNKWAHVVGAWNGSTMYVYLNGVQQSETQPFSGPLTATTGTFKIGRSTAEGVPFLFKGSMDEIRIYNHSLSAAEILDLYQMGSTHIADWSSWTTQKDASDSISMDNKYGGTFMQFKAGFNTNDTAVSPYLLNHSVAAAGNSTTPSIDFASPTRADGNITDKNGVYVNVSTTDDNQHSVTIDWNKTLVGWWRMEKGNGSFFTDTTGNNNGTCSGTICPEFTSYGKLGGAYSFDGVKSNITIAHNIIINLTNDMTITAWINRKSGAGERSIVEKWAGNGAYPYALRSDEDAGGRIQLSEYNGTTEADMIPTMTSNTAPSGVASASSVYSSDWPAWKAMDDNGGTTWASAYAPAGSWLKYQFTAGKTATSYTLTARNLADPNPYAPSAWTLQGSNNGADWTNLNSQSGISWTQAEKKTFTIASPASYVYYKLAITTPGPQGYSQFAEWELIGATAKKVTTHSVATAGEWTFIAATKNSTNMSIYMNGVFENETDRAVGYTGNKIDLYIGSESSVIGSFFNGSIDDVQIYSRALSASEINASYNAQLYKYDSNFTGLTTANYTYKAYVQDLSGNINSTEERSVVVDLTAPSASLTSPLDNSYKNTTTHNLTGTVTDDFLGILNTTVHVYNQSGLYNETSITGYAAGTLAATVGVVITFIDGIYEWFWSAFDIWGREGYSSANYTLTIDTKFPIINITTPINETNLTTSYVEINFTISDIGSGLNSVWWSNSSGQWNSTLSLGSNITKNWEDGRHNITIWLNDTAANLNSTAITFTTDTTAPNATFHQPENNTFTSSIDVNLSANISDIQSVKNATVHVYNQSGLYNETDIGNYAYGNVAVTASVVITFVDGVYKWFWSVFDWVGNQFSQAQNRTLTIDTKYPAFNFTSPTPANNSAISGAVNINVTVTEANLDNFTYNFNGVEKQYNVSNLTDMGSGKYSFNRSHSGLTLGAAYYYNVTAVDKLNNANTSGTRLFITNTLPTFISVTSSPVEGNNGSIDPKTNITVQANVSDTDFNLNFALFQWKNETALWDEATNVTLTNLTTINSSERYVYFIANFTTPNYQTNISYRIWANDTARDANYSNIVNLSSLWDCSWALDADDMSGSSGWDINKWTGNVSINNTGDSSYTTANCSLQFKLTHDLTATSAATSRIFFDHNWWKPSDTYTLAAGANQTVEINATFEADVKSESFTITSDEISSRSDNTSRIITGTLITSQAGPYLFQAVTSSPTTVYLKSGTNFTLDGYIKNAMGSATPNKTNTAYNVSFNWTLPSAITNVSAVIALNFTNISDSDRHTNQVNLSFSSLASTTAGSKIITLYGSGVNLTGSAIKNAANETLLTNTANITFLCWNASDGVCVTDCGYSQDADCEKETTTTTTTTTTSTGGSGGGGASGSGGVAIRTDAQFELMAGKEQTFQLPVCNKYAGVKEGISISVSGMNAKYIEFEPKTIEKINPGECVNVNVRITAPAYFAKGKYILTFDLLGSTMSDDGVKQTYQEQKRASVYIVEVNREVADTMMNESSRMVAEMEAAGLVVKDISALYDAAKSDYDAVNFENVKTLHEKIKEIYDAAIESKSLLEDLNTKIRTAEKNGINVIESKKILYVAETAFNRGDYVLALERLREAKLTYALEVKGEFNLIYSAINNPLESLGILLGASVLGFASSFAIRLQLYKRKLRLLQEEEKLLLELMKVVQRECFLNRHMSMEEYEEAMAQYEQRLSETVEDKIRVETKLANLVKLRGKNKSLAEEKEKLVELIKKTQDDYMNKGTIETRIYENMIKSYTSRLSEVEEQIAFLEAQKVLSSNKPAARLAGFFGWAASKIEERKKPRGKKKNPRSK